MKNLTISGHHIELTDGLREHVKQKLSNIVSHFDNLINVKVLLSVESKTSKPDHKAEVTLSVKGNDIFASATASDLYVAIDQVVPKLQKQVKKYRDKHNDHKHVKPNHAQDDSGIEYNSFSDYASH